MSYLDALLSHLYQSVCDDLGLTGLVRDGDGDYPLEVDGVRCWAKALQPDEDGPVLVRVWSRAAVGVKRSLKVLAELNDANTGWTQVRCVWEGDTVFVAGEIELESVEPGELGRLSMSVAAKAQHLGELITAVHGGTPAFAAANSTDQLSLDLNQHPPTSPKP